MVGLVGLFEVIVFAVKSSEVIFDVSGMVTVEGPGDAIDVVSGEVNDEVTGGVTVEVISGFIVESTGVVKVRTP